MPFSSPLVACPPFPCEAESGLLTAVSVSTVTAVDPLQPPALLNSLVTPHSTSLSRGQHGHCVPETAVGTTLLQASCPGRAPLSTHPGCCSQTTLTTLTALKGTTQDTCRDFQTGVFLTQLHFYFVKKVDTETKIILKLCNNIVTSSA